MTFDDAVKLALRDFDDEVRYFRDLLVDPQIINPDCLVMKQAKVSVEAAAEAVLNLKDAKNTALNIQERLSQTNK